MKLLPLDKWLETPSYKGIPVHALLHILNSFPRDWVVTTNHVHNLLVLDDELIQRGYVDLMDEKYEEFGAYLIREEDSNEK